MQQDGLAAQIKGYIYIMYTEDLMALENEAIMDYCEEIMDLESVEFDLETMIEDQKSMLENIDNAPKTLDFGGTYFEKQAQKMAKIPVNKSQNNVVFTDGKGGFEVKSFETIVNGGRWTFDDLCQRLENYNAEGHKNRALYVTGPCQYADNMITYCAPMQDKKVRNNGIKGKKGVISEIYCI